MGIFFLSSRHIPGILSQPFQLGSQESAGGCWSLQVPGASCLGTLGLQGGAPGGTTSEAASQEGSLPSPSRGTDTPSKGGLHSCMLDSPRCVSLNLSDQTGDETALQAENQPTHHRINWSWGGPCWEKGHKSF